MMNKYSKAIGAVVGGVLAALAAFNIEVPAQYAELANLLTPIVGSLIGTWIAPKNAE
jgi:hypothetical protein